MKQDRPVQERLFLRHKDRRVFGGRAAHACPADDGTMMARRGFLRRDFQRGRRKCVRQTREAADRDPLTGLANRLS